MMIRAFHCRTLHRPPRGLSRLTGLLLTFAFSISSITAPRAEEPAALNTPATSRQTSADPFSLAPKPAATSSKEAASGKLKPNPGERVLLLRTRQVLVGRLRETATGFLISTGTGNLVIPFDQADFDAADLDEVYFRLKLRLKDDKPASHLRLAEWCLSQKMTQEAATELREALAKDPSNETVRIMLDRLDQDLRQQAVLANSVPRHEEGSLTIRTQRPDDDSLDDAEVRSLAGLDPETARQFVGSIQPILFNRCGNARCHGAAAENDFKLIRVRGGAGNPRLSIERNLGLVLKYVDPRNPARSRLLTETQEAHVGQTVFNGRAGAIQQETLRKWILEAARQMPGGAIPTEPQTSSPIALAAKTPTSRGSAAFEDGSPSKIQPNAPQPISSDSSASDSASSAGEPALDPPEDDAARSGNAGSQLTSFQQLLRDVKSSDRQRDAFDPNEFNRRYAGAR